MSTEPTFPFGQSAVWRPNPDWIAASNLRAFMERHAIASYDDLHARARADIAWFWDAAASFLSAARCVRKASTSAAPISEGCRLPCQSTKRRYQPT